MAARGVVQLAVAAGGSVLAAELTSISWTAGSVSQRRRSRDARVVLNAAQQLFFSYTAPPPTKPTNRRRYLFPSAASIILQFQHQREHGAASSLLSIFKLCQTPHT